MLAQELDITRLAATLQAMAGLVPDRVELKAPSPFSLPLMVERLREQLSTEKLKDRLDRMLAAAEAALDAPPAPVARRARRAPRSRQAGA